MIATDHLAADVRKALARPGGWILCTLWFQYTDDSPNVRVLHVEVDTETAANEEDANEWERTNERYAGEAFFEGVDGFFLTCPTDAATTGTPADDRARIERYRDGMVEVLDGARTAV